MGENVGRRIKEWRLRRKMSQEELATAIGTTKQNIYKYETGVVTNIPMDKIEAMAAVLEVSPSELMGWSSTSARDTDMLEALHQNPRLGLLFDRSRRMSEKDIDAMLSIADAILRERDGHAD